MMTSSEQTQESAVARSSRAPLALCAIAGALTLGVAIAVGTGLLQMWVPGQCVYNTGVSIAGWQAWLQPMVLWIGLVALVVYVLSRWLGPLEEWSSRAHWAVSILAAVLCFGFWTTLAALEPSGFAKLSNIVASEASGSYLMQAAETLEVSEILAAYRTDQMSLRHRARNKPPGPVLLAAGILKLSNARPWRMWGELPLRVHPGVRAAQLAPIYERWWGYRYSAGDVIGALMYALLTIACGAGALIPVYHIARLGGMPQALAPVLAAFALCPAFIMAAGQTVLVHVLLLSWALLFYLLAVRRNTAWGVGAGLLMAVGSVFTWFFFVASLLFIGWEAALLYSSRRTATDQDDGPPPWLRAAQRLVCMLLTMATATGAIYLAMGLNPLSMMDVAREVQQTEYAVSSRTYMTWLVFNLVDFLTFLGLPTAVLAIYGLSRPRTLDLSQAAFLAFGAALLLLAVDVTGVTRGEVARIWAPMMPAFLLGAAAAGRRSRLPIWTWGVLGALLLIQAVVFRHVLLLGGWG
jgi:hypothetical protein